MSRPFHISDAARVELDAKIRAVIDALDRVCSACLAATDAATVELLHRGRTCATTRGRT